MHIRIRNLTSTTKDNDIVLKVTKITRIAEVHRMIFDRTGVEKVQQKLYYRGKQLIAEQRINDYDIRLNDVIQLQIVENVEVETSKENRDVNVTRIQAKSPFYEVGDKIDVIDKDHGAWFEAKIIEIFRTKDDDVLFKIKMDRNVDTVPLEVSFNEIRPRSFYTFSRSELQPNMMVFVNYNIEEPSKVGFWYDFEITKINEKSLKGTLFVGKEDVKLENCTVKLKDIMRIEEVKSEREDIKEIPLRKLPFYCTTCKDNPKRQCRDCGCSICSKKESAGILILCDECDDAYHLACLEPPLKHVPSEDWYCSQCKVDDTEIVKAGERLKASKRKEKMPSYKKATVGKEWGKGMACVGRTSECTIVPKDHYGPVPGVEVGTCWKFRIQVSEAGIHRPHVAGIHGRENDGAYSLVLSGGYEDDVDNGAEFFYTGSGGRDLSGNRRVNGQSCDQKLSRMNKALALNCNVKFNEKSGGEAVDWKKGKPVRVVRNYKLRKHSKFAPLDGNRYDGIYKVVKYYPEKGKSGFVVWRYLLRRDDPEPAPWEKGGKELEMIYPPGHLEAETGKKRKGSLESAPKSKKFKVEPYIIDSQLASLMEEDAANEKLWKECKDVCSDGKQRFLSKVEEKFVCVCCQEILFEPVTVTCKHNVCKNCLKQSFSAEIYTCPWCRFDLGATYVPKVNKNLADILEILFPGYGSGR